MDSFDLGIASRMHWTAQICLICSNLQSFVTNLFLNAVPPSVSIDFVVPYRHIISRYKMDAVSFAVVVLHGNALHRSVVASTTTNK